MRGQERSIPFRTGAEGRGRERVGKLARVMAGVHLGSVRAVVARLLQNKTDLHYLQALNEGSSNKDIEIDHFMPVQHLVDNIPIPWTMGTLKCH